jgi:carboxyl-terminal processing protease
LTAFTHGTAGELDAAAAELKLAAGGALSGIVLDLRNNPGGVLDAAVDVADRFLDEGLIVRGTGRMRQARFEEHAKGGDSLEDVPMVVLVNAGSASASEIVAAALQDQGRATVMGTRSFGKGSVQTVMRLPVDGALKLTTALYYGPSGETIQAAGVEPDIVLDGVDENPDFKREVDLPGALPERGRHNHASKMTLDGKVCPAVGEDEDRELGCAIALLRAGSTDRFLASLGQ